MLWRTLVGWLDAPHDGKTIYIIGGGDEQRHFINEQVEVQAKAYGSSTMRSRAVGISPHDTQVS